MHQLQQLYPWDYHQNLQGHTQAFFDNKNHVALEKHTQSVPDPEDIAAMQFGGWIFELWLGMSFEGLICVRGYKIRGRRWDGE